MGRHATSGSRDRQPVERVYQSAPLRRSLGLTMLSTILPGAGLLWTRRRRLGAVLLVVTAVLTCLILVRVLRKGFLDSALTLGASSSALKLVMAAIVAFALAWIAAIVATARLTRPQPNTRDDRMAMTLTAVLCAMLVAAPSAWGVRTLAVQHDLLNTIFVTPDGGSTDSGPSVGESDPWRNIPRVNVLLIGSDAGTDRVGVRTDSMMVASINTHTGDTVLIGIPRNLENVPFPASNPLHAIYPDGYNCGAECLINAVWTLAGDRADLFPGVTNPGLKTTSDVVGEVVGMPIDYTVVIDLSGFAQLVDAMGGVTINVKERVCIGCKSVGGVVVGTTGYIEPGVQHLDGYHALWYARSRAMQDDFARMRRQRCVVGALISQVSPGSMLLRYPALAQVLKDHVSISIPQGQLPAWVPLVERIKKGTVRSLALTNKVIDVTNPDFAKIRALVANAISDHPTSTATSTTPSSTSSTSTTTQTETQTSTDTATPNDELTTLAAAC